MRFAQSFKIKAILEFGDCANIVHVVLVVVVHVAVVAIVVPTVIGIILRHCYHFLVLNSK